MLDISAFFHNKALCVRVVTQHIPTHQSHPWGSNPHFTDEEKDRFLARAQAIFDEGARIAREGRTGPARFEGRDLGSMECMTFFDGVLSVMPSFIHPYGGLGDPRRPGERYPSPEK